MEVTGLMENGLNASIVLRRACLPEVSVEVGLFMFSFPLCFLWMMCLELKHEAFSRAHVSLINGLDVWMEPDEVDGWALLWWRSAKFVDWSVVFAFNGKMRQSSQGFGLSNTIVDAVYAHLSSILCCSKFGPSWRRLLAMAMRVSESSTHPFHRKPDSSGKLPEFQQRI